MEIKNRGGDPAVYDGHELGYIGTIFYFITTTAYIWIGLSGILRAFVWMTVFIYRTFK